MDFSITAELDLSGFQHVRQHMEAALDRAVRKTAMKVRLDAKVKVKLMDIVDTGAGGESVVTDFDDQNAMRAAVIALRPGSNPVTLKPRTAKLEAMVAVGQFYMKYQNDGTAVMPARPFFTQAVHENQGTLKALATEELNKLR